MAVENIDTLAPKIVLGVAAHPDDLDFGMSGAVAKWASQGVQIYYLILTNGARGTADKSADPSKLTKIRRREQRNAAEKLGVTEVFFCDYEDCTLTVCPEVTRDIVRYIRKLKPDVVMTMDPGMLYNTELGMINHPDHRAAGQATLDAVYPCARDHLSFPELSQDDQLPPHKVSNVLLLNFNEQNYYIDISDYIEMKITALAAHVSQISDLEHVELLIRNIAEAKGSDIGVHYAEAFVRIDIKD